MSYVILSYESLMISLAVVYRFFSPPLLDPCKWHGGSVHRQMLCREEHQSGQMNRPTNGPAAFPLPLATSAATQGLLPPLHRLVGVLWFGLRM